MAWCIWSGRCAVWFRVARCVERCSSDILRVQSADQHVADTPVFVPTTALTRGRRPALLDMYRRALDAAFRLIFSLGAPRRASARTSAQVTRARGANRASSVSRLRAQRDDWPWRRSGRMLETVRNDPECSRRSVLRMVGPTPRFSGLVWRCSLRRARALWPLLSGSRRRRDR
jgi:hypothetical protein